MIYDREIISWGPLFSVCCLHFRTQLQILEKKKWQKYLLMFSLLLHRYPTG